MANCNFVELPKIVGKGYGSFWRSKKRFRVVKGSRGSKKSKTIALNMICRLIEYPQSNLVVVRKVKDTLKDSCYAELIWAINKLEVEYDFVATKSPLEIVRKSTGQKILFRGLDDPHKITSITVSVGYLNFMWIEEAYEITNESDFQMLAESIRGETPGSFKQVTLSFNPWSATHWLKSRFFDNPDDDTFLLTTTYKINEWLDESDLKQFELMKIRNPRRYRTAGEGEWGIIEGLIYENWEIKDFDINSIKTEFPSYFGLDFGYTHESAFIATAVDSDSRTIYIYDEIYLKKLQTKDLYERITEKGYKDVKITADSQDPRSIDELYNLGCYNIFPAKKGKGSVLFGIHKLQSYKIVIHPTCVATITEIQMYVWATDRNGRTSEEPVKENDHLMDSLRYALESLDYAPLIYF